MGFLNITASERQGEALLELRNDYAETIVVQDVVVGARDGSATCALFTSPVTVPAGEQRVINITRTLQQFSPGERLVQIGLILAPKPPEQPPAGLYLVATDGHACTRLEPVAAANK